MRYRVYYKLPAHAYITVIAEDPKEALRKAEEIRVETDDDLGDWEIDWGTTAEFAFILPDEL